MTTAIGVYKAIVAVQAALAKAGIAKDKTCTQGASYKFRGIDDVYNALAPFLAEHNLCIIPRIISKECVERISKSGGAVFYTTVEAEFDFVSAEDGSKHTARTYGEAMDSGDKGCNKAMSAAYKYAAFQTFCIPTEGDNDADATTHEVKPAKTAPASNTAATQQKTLSPEQQKYFPRVKAALDTLYGDDVAKKKAKIRELTTFTGKDGKPVDGVEDYRKLTGQRLQILCHSLEKLVPKNDGLPTMCSECRQDPCKCKGE